MSQFGVQVHGQSATKKSGNGARRRSNRDKKRREVGSYFSATKLSAENSSKTIRHRSGYTTTVLKAAGVANVLTKEGMKKVKITGVLESKDNRNFARQNIITKGTIINTELGKAVVTNRPGREGGVNAKIVD
jgi:small subunit ribosomal protein S8e